MAKLDETVAVINMRSASEGLDVEQGRLHRLAEEGWTEGDKANDSEAAAWKRALSLALASWCTCVLCGSAPPSPP